MALQSHFDQFHAQKSILSELLARGALLFSKLGLADEQGHLEELRENLLQEVFRVMVAGRFNSGKSTFINALLGEAILPVKSLPTTAIITIIRYAPVRSAVLHFSVPLPRLMPDDLPEEVKAHLRRHVGGDVPPMKISLAELNLYLTIRRNYGEAEGPPAKLPYEKAVISGDFAICAQDVVLADSPGLDEEESRDLLSRSYVEHEADAVIYLTSCENLGSVSEKKYIDSDIRSLGHGDLIFVNTKFDQVPAAERVELMGMGWQLLGPKTSFGKRGVFFIDGQAALEGRINGDTGKVAASGILAVEELVSDFLTHQKGQVKITHPATLYLTLIRQAMLDNIPKERERLSDDYSSKKASYEQIRLQAEKVSNISLLIVQTVRDHLGAATKEIHGMVRENLEAVITGTPDWIKDIKVESEIKVWQAKASVKVLTDEIIEKYQLAVDAYQAEWNKNVLTPALQRYQGEVSRKYEELLELFQREFKVLQAIRGAGTDGASFDFKGHPGMGNFALLDGDSFQQALARGLARATATITGIVSAFLLMAVLNPFMLVIDIVLLIFFYKAAIQLTAETKVKSEITKVVVAELKNSQAQIAEEFLQAIVPVFNQITQQLQSTLSACVEPLLAEVELIRRETADLETYTDSQHLVLDGAEDELGLIRDTLTSLVGSLN